MTTPLVTNPALNNTTTKVPNLVAAPKTTPTIPPTTPAPVTPPAYDHTTGLLTDYGKSQGLPEVNKPTNTAPTDTTTSTSGTSTDTTVSDATASAKTAQDSLDKANADYDAVSASVHQTLTNIQNGSIPLTPGESAQVTGLQQSFAALIQQQKLTNTGAQGMANIRGYQTGAAEYDPTFQAKTIGSIITAGSNKIADLNIQMASAVAQLTQNFKDNDEKAVLDSWNQYQQASQHRTDALQKTVDDANAKIKEYNDAQAQAEADAIKQEQDQRDFAEKVREFNAQQTEKQSEFKQSQSLEYAKLKSSQAGASGSDVPPEVVDAVIKNPALINLYSYTMKGKVLNAVIAASAGTNSNIGAAILGSKLSFDGAETSVKDAQKKLTNMTASESAATDTMQLAISKLQDIQSNSSLLSNISSPAARNAILNLKKNWGGNSDVVEYTNYVVDALNEYGKVISGATSGSGVTDAARGEAAKIIDAGYNPDQLQAAFDGMTNAMVARTNGLTDAISQATIKGIGGDSATNQSPTETSPADLYSAMFPPSGTDSTPVDPTSIFSNFVPN